MDLVFLAIISAIAFRGACWISYYANSPEGVMHSPTWTTTPRGKRHVRFYTYAAIPIACLNGFLMYSVLGLLVASVGTWLGMLICNLILRFNPGYQFMFFGTINVIWTLINIF